MLHQVRNDSPSSDISVADGRDSDVPGADVPCHFKHRLWMYRVTSHAPSLYVQLPESINSLIANQEEYELLYIRCERDVSAPAVFDKIERRVFGNDYHSPQ